MSPGDRPRDAGDVVASHTRDDVIEALLENLSRALTAQRDDPAPACLLRRFDDGYEQRIAMWPRVKRSAPESEQRMDFEIPDFGILRIFAAPPLVPRHRRLLAETIAWLGALMRAVPARRRWEKTRYDALRAQAEGEAAEVRIARARETERIRLVESMTTSTVRDLGAVRAMITDPGADFSWSSVAAAMGRVLHDFRTTVRGVFPAMLPERGTVETLHEVAASLPIAVEFRGDLGRRPRWEVESNFTHAVADVLSTMAVLQNSARVVFERDGALRARVRCADADSADTLTDALRPHRERLEALGGALTITGSDSAGVEVSVTVPHRSEVNWLPLSRRQLASRPVHTRVAALLDSARLPEEVVAPWRAELFAPARLLVLQQPLPAPLPGVQTVMCDNSPDRALSEQLCDHDGPWGRIDAVVCADAPGTEFTRALPHGMLFFSPGTDAASAAAMLTARAPVLAARRALAQISDHLRRRPRAEWLRQQVDHLTAGSHELIEDALLSDLARGTAPSIVDAEGAQVIGMHGGDRCARLGLANDATAASIEDAINARLERWSQIVNAPGLDHPSRSAAEVVLTSATRLLMA